MLNYWAHLVSYIGRLLNHSCSFIFGHVAKFFILAHLVSYVGRLLNHSCSFIFGHVAKFYILAHLVSYMGRLLNPFDNAFFTVS